MIRLETDRLVLRPPELRDAPDIARWVDDYDVAKNLASAPHPYTEENARAFVARMDDQWARGEGWCFAIVRKDDWRLAGCCGVHLKDGRFEIGYWLGKPFWNQGYCTEAVRRLVAFAFAELKPASVRAGWYYDNPASGRVLEKLGFLPDGAEMRGCLARGHDVTCNNVLLTAADFGQKGPFEAVRLETR